MPYKETTKRRGKLSSTTEEHLLAGLCLINFTCEICSGGAGQSHAMGVPAHTLNADARKVWEKNRDRLLTLWRDPTGPKPGASGFSPEHYRGAGRLGLPCWAEIQFDGAKLPKFDRTWPQDIKAAWRDIKEHT